MSAIPLAPGPPGLTSSEPIGSSTGGALADEESSICPAAGSAQSSGAVTVVQSKPSVHGVQSSSCP